MAEAADLAASFNSAVECINYVRLGRNFGRIFQVSSSQITQGYSYLDGGSVAGPERKHAKQDRRISPKIAQAQALQGQTPKAFAPAEAISDKFRNRTRTDTVDGTTLTPATSTDSGVAIREPVDYPDPAPR